MAGDEMDFEAMVPGVFRGLMVSALQQAARSGLSGERHFYITYNTDHADIVMADSLRALYPKTITIVLQHEFWDLKVTDEGFSVSLAFNGVSHRLGIPFDAVTGFADPGITFSIQFNAPQASRGQAPASRPQAEDRTASEVQGEIIALDAFRKK